jgi:hypothetical protein
VLPGHRLAHQQTDHGMAGQSGAGITVRGTGQGLMNAERFFPPTVGLTRHIDDGDQGAFLRFIQIGRDDVIHSFGQSPTFQQTDLAIAGADETVVGISHHRDKPNRLVAQHTISDFQRSRQTIDRFGARTQGVEPVQTSQGIRTHERSP